MNSDLIMKAVKDKFGSLRRFCDISGEDFDDTRRLLARARKTITQETDKELRQLKLKIGSTRDGVAKGEISDQDLKLWDREIYEVYGSRSGFARIHGFRRQWLYTLFNGGIRKRTPKVERFLKCLFNKSPKSNQ